MSYENPRVKLSDSMPDILAKMAGGNPGALTVMLEMIKQSPTIDPQNLMGGLAPILSLDTENIYEHRIWMLYKDVCGQDMIKTLACLRASQLGFTTTSQLNNAIDGKNDSFDVDDLLAKVKKRLEGFDKKAETPQIAPEGNIGSTE